MNGDSVRDLIERYAQSRDPQYLAPDATVEQVPLGRLVRGRGAVGAMFRAFYLDAFSEADEQIREIAVDETRGVGVVESILRGRRAREVLGIPLSGSPVELRMVGIYEVEDGLIARGRLYFDVASLLGEVRRDGLASTEPGPSEWTHRT